MASLLESVVATENGSPNHRSFTVVVVAACPFPAPRGTPIRILRLSEALAARGHRVHVVTYDAGDGPVAEGVTVHRIPRVGTDPSMSPGPSYRKLAMLDPLLAIKLSQVLRRYPVDVIHAHHYEGVLVAAAARARTGPPLVYDAHTMLISELPSYGMGLPASIKRGVAQRLDRWLPGRADHVTSVTERISDKLIALGAVPEHRITVVPNGVELEQFGMNGSASASRNGKRTLIFTGNLAPYQGIEFMLAAFRKILDRRSDVRLAVVAGSSLGPYEPVARELGVRDSIDLVAAGFDQVPFLLAGADVALNPRIGCDGIPLKLLNYLAAAKPVVSFESSAPGLRHRETAWLANDHDTDGFANGALALLADPPLAASLGTNGRRFVEANHSWDRSAARTEGIFASLLAGARRHG